MHISVKKIGQKGYKSHNKSLTNIFGRSQTAGQANERRGEIVVVVRERNRVTSASLISIPAFSAHAKVEMSPYALFSYLCTHIDTAQTYRTSGKVVQTLRVIKHLRRSPLSFLSNTHKQRSLTAFVSHCVLHFLSKWLPPNLASVSRYFCVLLLADVQYQSLATFGLHREQILALKNEWSALSDSAHHREGLQVLSALSQRNEKFYFSNTHFNFSGMETGKISEIIAA